MVGVTNPRLLLLCKPSSRNVGDKSDGPTMAVAKRAHLCGAHPFTIVTSEVIGERVKWR